MLSLRIGCTGRQKGEDHVNAYAIFAVNEHLEFLLDEAAQNRAVNAGKPGFYQRIVKAVESFRMTFVDVTDGVGSVLPKFEDYPYRG
jgi:hypothetical protein